MEMPGAADFFSQGILEPKLYQKGVSPLIQREWETSAGAGATKAAEGIAETAFFRLARGKTAIVECALLRVGMKGYRTRIHVLQQ